MSWESHYVCDWCGRRSQPNIREDGYHANGWINVDREDLCKSCVAFRQNGIDALKKSRRSSDQSSEEPKP